MLRDTAAQPWTRAVGVIKAKLKDFLGGLGVGCFAVYLVAGSLGLACVCSGPQPQLTPAAEHASARSVRSCPLSYSLFPEAHQTPFPQSLLCSSRFPGGDTGFVMVTSLSGALV